MRSKLLLLLFIAFCFVQGCKSGRDGKFTVNGTILNMPAGTTVVLEEQGVTDVITELDSDKLNDKGEFSVSSNSPEPAIFRLHFTGNKFILLSVDNGTITVKGDRNAIERSQITGSGGTASLQRLLSGIRDFQRDFTTMGIVLDTLQARGNDSILAAAKSDFRKMNDRLPIYLENYADTTIFLPNAIFAARILNARVEKNYLIGFTQNLDHRFPNSTKAKDFVAFYAQLLGGGKQKTVAPQSGGAIGGIAPELKLPTINGAVVSLSSLRGKYVLLDFWASWCGPCRAENPNVVAAYNRFKDKNFTVYSVSLDNNKDSWQKAVKDDNLAWPTHVSDLVGWGSNAAKTYNIESIPANFLIDPAGKIIARNLRGDNLDSALAHILK